MNLITKTAITVCTVFLLTGCTAGLTHASSTTTPLAKVNTMTPDEAVAKQILPLADAAAEYIGDGWEPDGTLTPGTAGQEGDECTLPNGKKGVNFSIFWTGPGVADVDATAKNIQAAWKKLGTDLPIVTDDTLTDIGPARVLSDPAYLTGTYADGYGITLTIATKSTSMQAYTHCSEQEHE